MPRSRTVFSGFWVLGYRTACSGFGGVGLGDLVGVA